MFEYLVMTLAIWNAIWTPLTISINNATELGGTPLFVAIDTFVDVIFWLDIIFGFCSSYVDQASGDEIMAPKMIAKHYII